MRMMLDCFASPSRLGVVAGALTLVVMTAPSHAQFEDCLDTIALYSPTGFSARYEVATSPQRVDGVRLHWDELPDSLAGCVRLAIDPELESKLGVEVRGYYRNLFDRNLQFQFTQAGQVGDPDQARVEVSVVNDHLNPAAPDLNAVLNLSSAGGIYRFAPQTVDNAATQVNAGFPAHLGDVAVNAIGAAVDRSVVYAAVQGIPVLRSFDDGMTWEEPVERIFPPFSQRMTALVVFPDDPERVWLGVNNRGVWESRDGAETWTQIFPAGVGATNTVSLMRFMEVPVAGGGTVWRLYLGVNGQRFAYSDDGGFSWVGTGDFVFPGSNSNPVGAACETTNQGRLDVFDIEQSPTDPSRVFVGVGRWGVYEGSTLDHSTWTARNRGLIVCDTDGDPRRTQGEQRTVVQLVVLDNAGEDVLVAATRAQSSPDGVPDVRSETTVFISVDGGANWITKGDGFPSTAEGVPVAITAMRADPRASNPLGVVAATFGEGLWELNLGGAPGQGNWVPVSFATGQGIRNGRTACMYVAGNGELLVGTSDSGVYRPGVWIDLTRALNRNALSFDGVTTLGLQVRFTSAGQLQGGEAFSIKAQNYRGYAVWRAVDIDREADIPVWELIGLLDRANPEACVKTTCDVLAQELEVNCFANKRANCFEAQLDETEQVASWEFFDRDVFNGYTYWYAVSSFDFGYTGETSPESFDGGMLFSPRWPVETDPAAEIYTDLRGGRNYNGELFQVNVAAVAELKDDEIFVVPNPLVRAAGWDLGDASSIRIVNVTPSSKAEIYTVSGDLVRKLENVDFAGIERGNIEWDTRNADGEPVASGVYIYRVTDDQGGEVIGRFTIIR